MIKTVNLTKKFRNITAIENLNLEIPAGEIFGFLGPNGAGKTTVVKLLTGLLRPSAGESYIGGFNIQRQPLEVKQMIGLVPDQPFIYPKLTGKEFLRFIGDLYHVPLAQQKQKIPEFLEMFELKEWGDELVESYSHGMRQKLVFSSVLLHSPKVLFMDEPMVGLDPKSARLLKEILLRLSRSGVTLFMCTHVLEIAEKLCHRIGIVVAGRMIALGTQRELREMAQMPSSGSRDGQTLEDVFLSLTGGTEYASLLKGL